MKFWKTKRQKKSKDKNLGAVFLLYMWAAGVMVLNFYGITGHSELEGTHMESKS